MTILSLTWESPYMYLGKKVFILRRGPGSNPRAILQLILGSELTNGKILSMVSFASMCKYRKSNSSWMLSMLGQPRPQDWRWLDIAITILCLINVLLTSIQGSWLSGLYMQFWDLLRCDNTSPAPLTSSGNSRKPFICKDKTTHVVNQLTGKIFFQEIYECYINSLSPSDAYMRQLINQHWFRWWLVAWTAPSHYLNQCWNIVKWTPRNKLQWNFNWNSYIFIQKMHLKISSAKWRPYCLYLNVLRTYWKTTIYLQQWKCREYCTEIYLVIREVSHQWFSWVMKISSQVINLLRAKFSKRNINICLHFMSFL